MKNSLFKITILILISLPLLSGSILASTPNLESSNYKIVNPNIDSGGGVSSGSTIYGLLQSLGQMGADTRLESTNYALRSGEPNPYQANVPIIGCFEATSTGGSTLCNYLPNSAGMIGECGDPGCYDRVKLEVNDQNNPYDTLYLVALSHDSWNTTWYLQSDHSLETTYDINDYMTQCELEGRDDDDSNCDDSGDGNWNASLQQYNVLGLGPMYRYEVKIRAVHGDFTETRYSSTGATTLTHPSIGLDLDISETDSETSAPYSLHIGGLHNTIATTAPNKIWVDVSTNAISGVNVYVHNDGQGLLNTVSSQNIPSESEDLDSSDGDGGYGFKISSVTEGSLGPLQSGGTYNTAGANEVGALSSSTTVVLFTNTTGSNVGPLNNGRGSIFVKARSYTELSPGFFEDNIYFSALGNW